MKSIYTSKIEKQLWTPCYDQIQHQVDDYAVGQVHRGVYQHVDLTIRMIQAQLNWQIWLWFKI